MYDIGIGEEKVMGLEGFRVADALGEGPQFAGPAEWKGIGVHYREAIGRRSGERAGGGAIVAMVVHQDDVELAGILLGGQ